ncbi:hypothetical protein CYY_003232 [Polysphondylium violaceum]|uniref:Transcriptional regulator of RNA polII, SAGA, subunit-domain-containing protein n=1 Tax=Polysphondylium violaceum TaxID=133409 RepID=A0A8J4UUG4_9MYCE|nr:hypothetical protein CYY_003232 [Polysphondylium violaceum]
MAVDSHSTSLNSSIGGVGGGSSSGSHTTTTTTTTSSSSQQPQQQQQPQQLNIPTLFGASVERIDLVPLKKQLELVLKENSEAYWDWIRKFFAAKLSKIELDYYVKLYISENNLHLHNSFFKAILQNALYAKTPPPINQENRLKRKSSSSSSSKTKDKSSSSSSKKADKKKEATEKGKAPPSKKLRPNKKPSSSSNLAQPLSASTAAATTVKSKHLYPKYSFYASEVKSLKSRMESIVEEQGLTGISKQSIIYMKFAIEQYLSNILSSTVPHFKSSLAISPPPPSATSPDNDDENISKLNQKLPPSHLLYQYDLDDIQVEDMNTNNNNSNNNDFIQQTEENALLHSISNNSNNDNNSSEHNTTTTTPSLDDIGQGEVMIGIETSAASTTPTITTATEETANCNNNNNNNNNNNLIDDSSTLHYNTLQTPNKPVNFSSIFDFNSFNQHQQIHTQLQQQHQQSKYIQSTNPLLTQKIVILSNTRRHIHI